MAQRNNQPVQRFRIGLISAAVWKNDGFYSVTLQRSYKENDEWKQTEQLGAGDLLNAAKVLTRCEEWIAEQQ